MSKLLISFFFKTNLSAYRSAILSNDTNRICRILDVERDHISKVIDTSGNTALLLAIKYASPLTVRVLLEQGAQPNQTNGFTNLTPLSVLASKIYEDNQSCEAKNALEMAKILLECGAYVDKPSPYLFTDENGKDYLVKETPLMTAVRTKNLSMAKLFIEKQANVNYIDKQTKNGPIHYSITNGDIAMFDLLDNAGTLSYSILTNGDNTLLHWFCYNKANDQHISLLKKLIDKDCDVNAENNLQRTPLMLAAKLNMINTCDILIKNSADINKVDYQGLRAINLTPLDSECFQLLQIKPQSDDDTDRVVLRKHIGSTRSLSMNISDSNNFLNDDENKFKRYSLNSIDQSNQDEIDTKYKRVWEKFLQTKQRIRRTRDASLQKPRDSSRQRQRNSSEQRQKNSSEKRQKDSSEQRQKDSSEKRNCDFYQEDIMSCEL